MGTARELTSRAEQAVADNIATPCIANASSLLALALANVLLGDDREARRLQHEAEALGMEGYGAVLDPLYVEIAVARGDTAEVERKLSEWQPEGFEDVDGLIGRLNALVALDRRPEIEAEAPALVKADTYLEPFALRALGFARDDDSLITQAIERFTAMGMDWYATETRNFLAPPGSSG